ncbi:MAG: hypothetical protein CMJ80_15450 [Planctomycetaceae bacterium]|nr:hypothetical protein [Planctomycetaceae bacterium]
MTASDDFWGPNDSDRDDNFHAEEEYPHRPKSEVAIVFEPEVRVENQIRRTGNTASAIIEIFNTISEMLRGDK